MITEPRSYPSYDDEWIETAHYLEMLAERIRNAVDADRPHETTAVYLDPQHAEKAVIRAAWEEVRRA